MERVICPALGGAGGTLIVFPCATQDSPVASGPLSEQVAEIAGNGGKAVAVQAGIFIVPVACESRALLGLGLPRPRVDRPCPVRVGRQRACRPPASYLR